MGPAFVREYGPEDYEAILEIVRRTFSIQIPKHFI